MWRAYDKETLRYDHVPVYLDYLLIASKSFQLIVDNLIIKNRFKVKGTGPITYHLVCDFNRDSNNELCLAPREHIEKMSYSCASIFGSNPKSIYHSYLEKSDHPEIETANFLDDDSI